MDADGSDQDRQNHARLGKVLTIRWGRDCGYFRATVRSCPVAGWLDPINPAEKRGAQVCLGQFEPALASHERALALYTEMDEPEHGPETQAAVVLVLQRLGRADQANAALARFMAPLDLADEALSPTARNRFGEALRMAGRWAEAERWYESALRAAEATSDRYEQARALDGLAYARWQAREPDEARRHGQAAQAHYAELEVPEAHQHRPWQR